MDKYLKLFFLVSGLALFLFTSQPVYAQSCSDSDPDVDFIFDECSPSNYACNIQATFESSTSLADVRNQCENRCGQPNNCCETYQLGSLWQGRCYLATGIPTPTPLPPGTSCGKPGEICCPINSGYACEGETLSPPTAVCCPSDTDTNQKCRAQSECNIAAIPTATPAPYRPCDGIPDGGAKAYCENCLEAGGAYTALGCIPTGDGTQFAASIMKILFAVAGGVAFLLMIYGAFICITSKGDPQKAQACRETITSAVVGLLMLVFALFIVRVIFGPAGFLPGIVTGIL